MGSAGAADLYPGFTQGEVHFTVNNPNSYPVTLTAFTATAVTSFDNTACPAGNVTVNDSGAISMLIAAHAFAAPETISNVVTMAGTAPDGCQSAVFTIALTIVARPY